MLQTTVLQLLYVSAVIPNADLILLDPPFGGFRMNPLLPFPLRFTDLQDDNSFARWCVYCFRVRTCLAFGLITITLDNIFGVKLGNRRKLIVLVVVDTLLLLSIRCTFKAVIVLFGCGGFD